MPGAQLLLVNPRRKKKSRKGRMPAGLRKYWAARRRLANPNRTKSRRRRHVAHARHRRINPRPYRAHRVHHMRRAHNPRLVGQLTSLAMPAAIGAGGALVLDVVYAKLAPMLPASLGTGALMPLATKILAAVGLGMLAGKAIGRDRARAATVGAVTVLAYGAAKTYLMANVPSLGLSGFADFVDYSAPRGMGAYMPHQLGFISPAPVLAGKPPGFAGLGAYMPHGMPAGMAGLADTGHDTSWQNDGM